jgi:hypothetical protein
MVIGYSELTDIEQKRQAQDRSRQHPGRRTRGTTTKIVSSADRDRAGLTFLKLGHFFSNCATSSGN